MKYSFISDLLQIQWTVEILNSVIIVDCEDILWWCNQHSVMLKSVFSHLLKYTDDNAVLAKLIAFDLEAKHLFSALTAQDYVAGIYKILNEK